MKFYRSLISTVVGAGLGTLLLPVRSEAQSPTVVLEDPVSAPGQPEKVKPVISVGKSLLIPVTGYSSTGLPLSFSVAVDAGHKTAVAARVKTGNPLLKLRLQHSGGAADPAYSGDLVFQLFNDWAPITTGYIAGFAQAGFYDGVIFHRLADLNKGTSTESFIYQGGDPQGTGSGGPEFSFSDEFYGPMTFTGRGQLAMANAGAGIDYKGTNGSQFFITHGNLSGGGLVPGGPRFLDFKHTVFGQLTHGWDLLQKLHDTPRSVLPADKPVSPVTISSASVVTQYDDGTYKHSSAVLVLTATAALAASDAATLTVTASDGQGGQASKAFTVKTQADQNNSRPYAVQPADVAGPKDKLFSAPLLKRVDLERDYVALNSEVLDPVNVASQHTGDRVLLLGKKGFQGSTRLRFLYQQYDSSYRGEIDGPGAATQVSTVNVNIGLKALDARALNLEPSPGVAFTGVKVATFVDSNLLGGTSGYTATINWGDGTAPQAGTIARDSSRNGSVGGAVQGSHIYARAGVYPLQVDFSGAKGFKSSVRGVAVVSAQPLRATGENLQVTGSRLSKRQVARIRDLAPVSLDQYSVTIDWGDGALSGGQLKSIGNGEFAVLGSHLYSGAEQGEPFSVSVRVGRPGVADAVAWSRVQLRSVRAAKHLPPLDHAHLVGEISPIQLPKRKPKDAQEKLRFKPLRATAGSGASAQTHMTAQMVVLNSGNVTSKPGLLHFYLSKDRSLKKPEAVPGKSDNPADIALKIGTKSSLTIPALKPGTGVRFLLDKGASDLRLRLPLGEDGTGYNLLGAMSYKDRLADHQSIDRAAVEGVFDGVEVSKSEVVTTKGAGPNSQASFDVRLLRKPTHDVTVKFTSSNPTQGDVVPSSVTFLATEWTPETVRTVVVSGKDDGVRGNDAEYSIAVDTESADIHFRELNGAFAKDTQETNTDVTVSNLDNVDRVVVTPTTATTPLVTQPGAAPGNTATFQVRLAQKPESKVTVTLGNGAPAEGWLSKSFLEFTPSNWSANQSVTLTAQSTEGTSDVTYEIAFAVASDDLRFKSAAVTPVRVTNIHSAAP
jgi:peptidyl-prolyl cis-trans isomerase A (cyclophilin A)